MVLVVLETPYAASDKKGVLENIEFARACMRDCLLRGEAPIASHLLYTQDGVLDDNISSERMLGIEAGLLWGRFAEKTVVYADKGISKGMQYGIQNAKELGRPVEIRFLNKLLEGSINVESYC